MLVWQTVDDDLNPCYMVYMLNSNGDLAYIWLPVYEEQLDSIQPTRDNCEVYHRVSYGTYW